MLARSGKNSVQIEMFGFVYACLCITHVHIFKSVRAPRCSRPVEKGSNNADNNALRQHCMCESFWSFAGQVLTNCVRMKGTSANRQ